MQIISYYLVLAIFTASATSINSVYASTNKPISVALDDLPGIDMLAILTAFEQAKKRGVNLKIKYLQSENMAANAVISGHADIGIGTPYKLIQRTNAKIRMLYQLNRLRFYPVANADYIKTWADLNGQPMITHGEGSGTEALMNMYAKENGIQYSKMTYIPGSGVRANAMIRNQIKATIVDIERRNMLLSYSKGNFHVLPIKEINASDEAIYANQDFIHRQKETLKIIIEEFQDVWLKMITSPQYIVDAQNKYNLIPSLGKNKHAEILKFYNEMVDANAFATDGGIRDAFTMDKEFYGFAETLDTSKTIKEQDFWDFNILKEVLKTSP